MIATITFSDIENSTARRTSHLVGKIESLDGRESFGQRIGFL
jgi:hypothetical protein